MINNYLKKLVSEEMLINKNKKINKINKHKKYKACMKFRNPITVFIKNIESNKENKKHKNKFDEIQVEHF